MLKDLRLEAGAVGLELHMGKTKILSNGIGPETRSTEADIGGQKVEVLSPTDSTMYLGRALNLKSPHETEINHRVSRAWCKFGQYKKELMSKAYPLSDRLRLFNAVVTPTVLYGSGAWVMTKAREQKLRTAQRRMLRSILGKGRAKLQPEHVDDEESSQSCSLASSDGTEAVESWVEWIKRVTADAEVAMEKVGIPDWVEEQHKIKWRWCGHVCRSEDGRWSRKILEWTPQTGHRNQGRPYCRWSDDVDAFTATLPQIGEGADKLGFAEWSELALSREVWSHLQGDFSKYCSERWS